MEERFTVQLDTSVHPDKMESLAERLGEAFLLTQEEALALLSADSLVLKRAEALALVKMCRKAGVGVTLNAPLLTPAVHTQRWLKRYTLPVVFSLSSALALLALILWIVPNSSPQTASENEAVNRGGVVALPWVESASPTDNEVIAVEPGSATPGVNAVEAVESVGVDSASAEPQSSAQVDAPLVQPDLFSAARDFSGGALEAVLDRSPDLELRDAYGQTPLMYAAGSNAPDSVAKFVAAGADPNTVTDAKWTALMYAARNVAHPEVVSVLLGAGADPTLKNSDGQTAKDIALAHNHVDAVAMLEAALAPPLQQAQEEVPPSAPVVTESPAIVVTPFEETGQTDSPLIIDDSALPIVDSAPESFEDIPLDIADPALSLFERQETDMDDDESRNTILNCLQDWANCAED